MADLEFRKPSDDDLEPFVDPMDDPIFEDPEPTAPESDEPSEEEAQYLADLKGKPSLLEKFGLVPKEKFEKVAKAANDNRREFRTLSEKVARIEQQREVHALAPSGPTSEELWAKFDESGDPKDRAAALKAQSVEMEQKFDARLKAHESQITQTFSATQYQKELDAELAKPENAGINMDEVDEYFANNRTSNPAETIFIYRARQHKGGLNGYLQDYARSLARQPQGANTAPAGGGTRRQQFPASAGRRLTKEEALADYRGQKG